MSINEMDNKIKELRELRRMADELSGNDWKVTWKLVNSRRFDAKAFKATHAELYNQYCSETSSRRFVVA